MRVQTGLTGKTNAKDLNPMAAGGELKFTDMRRLSQQAPPSEATYVIKKEDGKLPVDEENKV